MARIQNELDPQLENELKSIVSDENKDELDFYLGLVNKDASIVSILNSNDWDEDQTLFFKGLYEMEFEGGLNEITENQMMNFIDNAESGYTNYFIDLISLQHKELLIPYVIEQPKNPEQLTITDVKTIADDYGFEIYPNPANNELNILYSMEELQEGQFFRIYDAKGSLVYQETIKNNSEMMTIDISRHNR